MKNKLQDDPSSKETLKFENELLKLKLHAEFGMEEHGASSELSPEIENIWLNNIYAFEEQFKNAGQIKVFEALGSPVFTKVDDLTDDEIPKALTDIQDLMDNKAIVLDTCCEYDDRTIYRFITEELFQCEIDDVFIPGMVRHFIYEEFHPNHDYDLRAETEQIVRNILERKWDPEFNTYSLADTVTIKRKTFERAAISSLILDFQAGREFEIKKLDIVQVSFSMENKTGKVNANLEYSEISKHPDQIIKGSCEVSFVYDAPVWRVSRFRLPGF